MIIVGTDGADLLTGTGTSDDTLIGLAGGDTYRPTYTGGHDYIIDDQGGDAPADTLDVDLYNSPRFVAIDGDHPTEYFAHGPNVYGAGTGWAMMERVGDDLHIWLSGKPAAFHVPGHPAITVTISGQYTEAGHVEQLTWDGALYTLDSGTGGTAANDILAGDAGGNVLRGHAGDDLIWAAAGDDQVDAGAGVDRLFLGDGADTASGGAGNDQIFAYQGADSGKGGAGDDWLFMGADNDLAKGSAGADWLAGEDGADRLLGGAGTDRIVGGADDDALVGGQDGDRYDFYADNPNVPQGWGHDTIEDAGGAGVDSIMLYGLVTPGGSFLQDAIARLDFARAGDDMTLSLDGGASTIAVNGAFGPAAGGNLESLIVDEVYWTAATFQFRWAGHDAIGDDRGPSGDMNEIIFGSDAADSVFTGAGWQVVWLGAGADTMIYKETDPYPLQEDGSGGATLRDVILDFNPLEDRMDFTEITSVGMSDLVLGVNGEGDATVFWDSGSVEVADILVELRGVAPAELTADNFLFG